MKSFIRLTDFAKEDILKIFYIADELQEGKYKDFLKGRTIAMFFPESSIRTRVTFERGIYLLGGQSILFSPQTLDKKEDIQDVMGYLNNWTDAVIVRHKDIGLLEKMQAVAEFAVINAMTDINHPCEVLADVYALSKLRGDWLAAKYLFCGRKCNIGLAWKEIAEVLELDFVQACPKGYEMEGVNVFHDLEKGIVGKDIVCTDSLPKELLSDFENFQITEMVMKQANKGALLNPCPPFYRGEEVAADAIDSSYFVGYEFKKHLLEIQQAVLIYCMS